MNKSSTSCAESERETFIKGMFRLRQRTQGMVHFVRLEALQNAQNARTLRYRNGKVSITDGLCAETKEQIGGVLLLDANDLNHATELMSKHPGIRVATFEIRALTRNLPRRSIPPRIRERAMSLGGVGPV